MANIVKAEIRYFFNKEKEYATPIHCNSSLESSSFLFKDTFNAIGYSSKIPQLESITQTLGDSSSKYYLHLHRNQYYLVHKT